MIRSRHLWLTFAAGLILTIACVGSSVPTTSPSGIETIVAATMQAITPAASPTAQLSPSALPTATTAPTFPAVADTAAPAATRINFLTNATTGVVTAPIQPGQSIFYVLQASQAQPMIVRVDSLNNDITLSVKTQGGTSLLSAGSRSSSWQGTLPQTEDYYIGVFGGGSTENFTLTIEIPSRIKFAAGTVAATVRGQTVAGYSVAYTVFAIKGQKMTVNLNGVGSDGALTIYGFVDGQPYVRSVTGQTSFTFKLPSTQDYVIEVVPWAGKVITYSLVVKAE